jgi:hypothetical protein
MTQIQKIELAAPNWHEHLPNIFTDFRFRKTTRRRYQFPFNGIVAGIAVAWRPADYDNFALNKDNLDRLLELRRDGSFAAAFVVLASAGGTFDSAYIGHRNAEELYETLKTVPFRKGPHGDYWLLRTDFSPFDAPDPLIPF